MERGDNRHSQFAQECQDVSTRRSAKNAELVLQADDVHVADVEEIRGTKIGGKVLFLNFEANYFGVLISINNVIDGNRETLALWMRSGDGAQQIGRKRRDAALAWQVIADKSNLADLRILFDELLLWIRVQARQVLIVEAGRIVGRVPVRSLRPLRAQNLCGLKKFLL
jgi:hypothetical protein